MPRAAATKNKMRMAEKAFIYLLQVKNISRKGFILQIFLISLKGQEQMFVIDSIKLKFHNNFILEMYEFEKGCEVSRAMPHNSATDNLFLSTSKLHLSRGSTSFECPPSISNITFILITFELRNKLIVSNPNAQPIYFLSFKRSIVIAR